MFLKTSSRASAATSFSTAIADPAEKSRSSSSRSSTSTKSSESSALSSSPGLDVKPFSVEENEKRNQPDGVIDKKATRDIPVRAKVFSSSSSPISDCPKLAISRGMTVGSRGANSSP